MWYDILVLAILIFFTVRGAARGMVWQLAGIVGIVLCFVFADAISAFAGPYVQLEPPLNNWVILFGAYIAFTFVAFILAGRIEEYLTRVKLKEFDRHLGAVFGFVKGVVLCLIMTFLVVTVSEDARVALKQSRSGIAAARIVKVVHPYLPILPDDLIIALEKYIHLLDENGAEEHYADDHNHVHDGHNHDEHGNEVSLGNEGQLESGSFLPSGNTASPDWLKRLSGLVSQQTQQSLISAINQESDPQKRNAIIKGLVEGLTSVDRNERIELEQDFQKIGSQGAQFLLSHLSKTLEISNSSPSTIPNSVSTIPSQTNATQVQIAALRKQIVSAYTSDPAGRLEFEKQIEQFLGTLPEQVYLGVVKDWNADIWSLPDPDRQTSGQSTLEQRVLRQVELNGIRFEDLKPAMQQQLRAANNTTNGTQR